jgi:hypothetical protein
VSDLIWLSNYDSNCKVVQPFVSLNPDPAVPEPSSGMLAGTGLAISLLTLLRRRRRRRRLAEAKIG